MWRRRHVKAELFAHLIEGKMQLCLDHSPRDIIQNLNLELVIWLTYGQSWRARDFKHMMLLGKPLDHYKLSPWMCVAIVKENSGSVTLCDVNGLRFNPMFVMHTASLNEFKL